MENFIARCRKLKTDLYARDLEYLRQEFQDLCQTRNQLLDSDLTAHEKEYILPHFVDIYELNMYTVPVVKNMCERVIARYEQFHGDRQTDYGPLG